MRAVTQRVMARVPSGSWGDPDVSAETGRYHSGRIGINGSNVRSVCGRFALFGPDLVVQITVEFTQKYVALMVRDFGYQPNYFAASQHGRCPLSELPRRPVVGEGPPGASGLCIELGFDRPGPRLAVGALRSTRLGFWCWFRSSISEPAFRSRLRRQIEYPDQSDFSA